jgi:hypothetical protein
MLEAMGGVGITVLWFFLWVLKVVVLLALPIVVTGLLRGLLWPRAVSSVAVSRWEDFTSR